MADILNDILRAADRHPNSRVSKLIRLVEEEPSQKNIVLLLVELSDHAEYATDFGISLRYYLDKFERLGIDRDLILNEAGLLLVNSSKIYAKRVDYVQSLVERQIMTLSNADNDVQQQIENQKESSAEATSSSEKPKSGRKRALDVPTDPYEVQLQPKKFKKITQEKRFSLPQTPTKTKPVFRNVEMEQQIHPASWKYATIYDLENEEDVDTKRNYKLFTYHIEHRYNTLVPDINFRLHFKVKDYMDAQEEEMDEDVAANHNDHVWPSHSEEYVRKYISLENRVLQQEIDPTIPYVSPKRHKNTPKIADLNDDANMNETITLETSVQDLQPTDVLETTKANETALDISEQNFGINDPGVGTSDLESFLDLSSKINTTQQECTTLSEGLRNTTASADVRVEMDKSLNSSQPLSETDSTQQENAILSGDKSLINTTALTEVEMDKLLNSTQSQPGNDSGLGESILDHTNNSSETTMELNITLESDRNVNSTFNGNSTTDQILNDSRVSETGGKLPTSLSDQNPSEDKPSAESEDICVDLNKYVKTTEGHHADITSENLENYASSNKVINEILERSDLINSKMPEIADGNENTPEASVNCDNCVDKQNANVRSCTQDVEGLPVPNTEEIQKNVSQDNTVAIDKPEVFDVQIEVVNEDGNAESNTIQIIIPNCVDDEGVHLSDAYEDDFRLITPTLKIPNIMPGIERKDVTIYLDKELREALELHDSMVDHFFQETYKVPVIIEPKEQPLIFNILQLPPKLIKRKTLFKLGPDMDLYLKARTQKSTRSKSSSVLKHVKYFALNNMDMSGILETPLSSPNFLGFTDDDDSETTCDEFCGFTDDEQNKLLLHRLSRDSGVGVDATTLNQEKEPRGIIFEENGEVGITSCALDLGNALVDSENSATNATAKEKTEDLLSNLPTSIRNLLKAELQEGVLVCDATSKAEEIVENETESKLIQNVCEADNQNKKDSTIYKPQTTNETTTVQDKGINSEIQTSNEKENETTSEHQISKENIKILPEECISESAGGVQKSVNDHNTNKDKESTDQNIEFPQLLHNNCSVFNENCEVSKQNAVKDHSENSPQVGEHNSNPNGTDEMSISIKYMENIKINMNNCTDNESTQQDNAFFELDKQGEKTKIQQWHEHLRPILAKSRERHHFDVFQLGTEIIETIQFEEDLEQNKPTIVATFDDIMSNKDKSYVSRYFLSTLLLANQSNINISVGNKSSEMPSSWSDIQLQLISTKRHTVAIEDNIGMINNRKRKNTKPIVEDKHKKIKSTAKHRVDDYEAEESSNSTEDSEPLVNLQTISKNSKMTPTKRPVTCENINIAGANQFTSGAPSSSHQNNKSENPNEFLITSQIILPTIDISQMMPSTSKRADAIPHPENYQVNLNNIRILQPMNKLARQGDDLDSGIFSVENEMSNS